MGCSHKEILKCGKTLNLKEVQKFVPEAEHENVSRVARGKESSSVTSGRKDGRYFLEAFKQADGKVGKLSPYWKDRRIAFIHRHAAQYFKNPSKRRYLALAMWAWIPQ